MTVLVVGGGPAGLLAAWRAAQAGHDVTLFEASADLGGQLAALPLDILPVDAAAESFATRSAELLALFHELGLGDDIVPPAEGPAWLFTARGQALPLPATSLLGVPGDPAASDVSRVIGTPAALRARLDAILPANIGADARTLGDLVRARMGRVVVDGLVAPIVRGVHSRSPYDLPLNAAHPRLAAEFRAQGSLAGAVRALRAASPAGSAVAGIRGGMFRVARALETAARNAGAHIVLNARVSHVSASGVDVDGTHHSGHVILAAPLPETADDSRTITLATLVTHAPELDDAPRGTGLLVAPGTHEVHARALTHVSAKWSWVRDALPTGTHIIRLSYDGTPDDLERQAPIDAARLLGVNIGTPEAFMTRSWSRPLAGQPLPDLEGVTLLGERASGTGLASVLPHAQHTMTTFFNERIHS